jgi:hypothetical protein
VVATETGRSGAANGLKNRNRRNNRQRTGRRPAARKPINDDREENEKVKTG